MGGVSARRGPGRAGEGPPLQAARRWGKLGSRVSEAEPVVAGGAEGERALPSWPDPLAWTEAGVTWSQHVRHVPRAGRGLHASERSTGALTPSTATRWPRPCTSLRVQLRHKGPDARPPQPHAETGSRCPAEAHATAHVGRSGGTARFLRRRGESADHQREKRSLGRHENKTHCPSKGAIEVMVRQSIYWEKITHRVT